MRANELSPPTGPRAEARRLPAGLLAAALTVAALGLRLYRLDARSLWPDEIMTATTARIRGPEDLGRWFNDSFVTSPDQTPLFYVISSVTAPLAPPEIAARLPSAVFGALTVTVVYLLGKRLFSPTTGLLAACWVAVLPLAVWYSQEARPYALFTLLVCVQMLLAWEATRSWHLGAWLALLTVSVLAVFTHWFGALTVAAVATYGGLMALSEVRTAEEPAPAGRRTPYWRTLLGGGTGTRLALLRLAIVINFTLLAASCTLAWYLALQQGFAHQQAGDAARYPNAVPSLLTLAGRLTAFGLWWLPFLLAVVGGVAGAAAGRGSTARRGALLMITWLAAPLALLAIELHWRVAYLWDRYLLFLAPATALLVAAGCLAVGNLAMRRALAAARRQDVFRGRAGAATIAVCLCAVAAGGLIPGLATTGAYAFQTPKDDYRTVAHDIVRAAPPGSLILAMGPPLGAGQTSWLVYGGLHYYEQREGADIPITFGVDRKVADYLRRSQGTVWAVAYDRIPCSCDQRSPAVTVSRFPGMLVAKDADSRASPLAQARTLLAWGSGFQPSLRRDLALLASAYGPAG